MALKDQSTSNSNLSHVNTKIFQDEKNFDKYDDINNFKKKQSFSSIKSTISDKGESVENKNPIQQENIKSESVVSGDIKSDAITTSNSSKPNDSKSHHTSFNPGLSKDTTLSENNNSILSSAKTSNASFNSELKEDIILENSSNKNSFVNSEILADKVIYESYKNSHCERVDYVIKGVGVQYVEVVLYTNSAIICNDISLIMYYDNLIDVKTIASVSSAKEVKKDFFSKLKSVGKNIIEGKQLFMVTFANNSPKPTKLAFMSCYTGSIIHISLKNEKNIFCKEENIICAFKGVAIKNANNRELGLGGFDNNIKMKTLSGESIVFLSSFGNHIVKDILEGEKISVSFESIIAMESTVKIKTKSINNTGMQASAYKLLEVSGHGKIWLNSASLENLKENITIYTGKFFSLKKQKKKFLSKDSQK